MQKLSPLIASIHHNPCRRQRRMDAHERNRIHALTPSLWRRNLERRLRCICEASVRERYATSIIVQTLSMRLLGWEGGAGTPKQESMVVDATVICKLQSLRVCVAGQDVHLNLCTAQRPPDGQITFSRQSPFAKIF